MTVAASLRAATARLAAAGVEAAATDARLLLQAALGWDRTALLTRGEMPMDPEAGRAFAALIDRRAAREPVSRILGRREFWSHSFALAPATLDPRPDSETLVEAALAHSAAPRRILDLGTGTGCLLLAILSERPEAFGVGVDRSAAAAACAAANARALGLAHRAAFLCGDWAAALAGPFDLVVANPPYIPDVALAALEAEVRLFDPHAALAGGADGLDAYRAIAADLPRLLAPDGVALFEHGQGQAADVAAILAARGFGRIATPRDLSGVTRVCVVKKGIGTVRKTG